MGKKSSIYLSDDIKAKLRVPPRGPSSAVSAAIDRYDALLAPERKRLVATFSGDEWNAMRNACASTEWSGASIRGGVLANIQDSLDSELETFGVDRTTIEGKLAALSPAEQYALVEMIEAWWEKQGPKESRKADSRNQEKTNCRAAGVIRTGRRRLVGSQLADRAVSLLDSYNNG